MLFLLLLLISSLLQLLLPWWIIAPVAAILCAWKAKDGKQAFITAFFAINLLWIGMSLLQTLPNHHLLLDRVSGLFGLHAGLLSRILLVMITGLIGGLTAGIAGLAGVYWKQALVKKA